MEISVVLETRRATRDGLYPVKLRFTSGQKYADLPLKIYTTPEGFDKQNGLLRLNDKATKAEYQRHNVIIAKYKNKATEQLFKLRSEGRENISPIRFREMLSGGDKSEKATFNAYMQTFIGSKQGRTREIYETTLKKIEKNFGKNVWWDEINYLWLDKFRQSMIREGMATNGIGIHFRNIRAVFNHAINTETVGVELYPFRKFKIERAQTVKRNIPIGKLRELFDHQSDNSSQAWTIDMAKLIFYLIGINLIDLFYLKPPKDGYIEYERAKTGTFYKIKVEPEAMEIIERYKGENFALNVAEHFKRYDSFKKKVNEYLTPHGITSYSLRHTWATLASDLDVPKETISAALGHKIGSDITDIYINYDLRKVEAANRKVLDFVKQKKRQNTPSLSLVV